MFNELNVKSNHNDNENGDDQSQRFMIKLWQCVMLNLIKLKKKSQLIGFIIIIH